METRNATAPEARAPEVGGSAAVPQDATTAPEGADEPTADDDGVRDEELDTFWSEDREARIALAGDDGLARCDDPQHVQTFEGMRLYLRRIARGMTREELADRLDRERMGLRGSAWKIGAWEHEDAEPNATELCALARILGVHPMDLMLCATCRGEKVRRNGAKTAKTAEAVAA